MIVVLGIVWEGFTICLLLALHKERRKH